MIPSVTEAQAYKNKVAHIRNNLDFVTLRSAERWVNELIIDKITDKMREHGFSQKIWMNTKVMSSRIERDKVIVRIQNYYFSETGFDVAMAREYGTKNHWIRPRIKEVLSWIKEGKRLFSRGHIVSGIKSLLIIKNTIREQMPEVQRKLNQDVKEFKEGVFGS
jgi:hypothetical protein